MPMPSENGDQAVGDLAVSGTARTNHTGEPEPPGPRPTFDDLLDGLLLDLEAIHPAWGLTFPQADQHAKLSKMNKLIGTYGYEAVRRALEWCRGVGLKPKTNDAMPVLVHVCKRFQAEGSDTP